MHRWKSVAIIGVGMMGGSIGLAVQAAGLADRVVGVGRQAARLRQAQQRGILTDYCTHIDELPPVDLAVVCTPVATIPQQVLALAGAARQPLCITDAGSTKLAIVREIELNWPGGPAEFVGSHPLAGSEKAGAEHADSQLLQGRRVIVTPSSHCSAPTVNHLAAWWGALGAHVHTLGADEHDRIVAWISHLPHVVSALLAGATPADCLPWVASGWRDTTRVAGGDVQLWSQIIASNRAHLLQALDQFQESVARLRSAVFENQPADWERLLTQGKECRDAVAD